MTHYEALGLPASLDVTEAEIKAAYRRRALELHPDTTGAGDAPGDAAGSFRRIQDAYAVLRDSRSRRLYDRTIGIGGAEEQEEGPGMRARRAAAARMRQRRRGGAGGGASAAAEAAADGGGGGAAPVAEADQILQMYRSAGLGGVSRAGDPGAQRAGPAASTSAAAAAGGRLLSAQPAALLLAAAAAATAATAAVWWAAGGRGGAAARGVDGGGGAGAPD